MENNAPTKAEIKEAHRRVRKMVIRKQKTHGSALRLLLIERGSIHDNRRRR